MTGVSFHWLGVIVLPAPSPHTHIPQPSEFPTSGKDFDQLHERQQRIVREGELGVRGEEPRCQGVADTWGAGGMVVMEPGLLGP